MATSFADTSKAEECFKHLHQMRDNNIFKDLVGLIDEGTTFATGCLIRVILF
jgi:sister-chromatid-cohesion protein PDS5